MNKNFCVLFATKNHYSMFENCTYKYSKANFNDVIVLNVDIDSSEEEINYGKKVCEKLNIHYVNDDSHHYISNQNSIKAADDYLLKNKIDVDWILFFQHDVVPIDFNFWEKFDNFLNKNSNVLLKKVGMIGANAYQNYEKALNLVNETNVINKRKINTKTARGNLVQNILTTPYNGWYQNLYDSYYETEYFVVESPNWQCVAFNRNLFRKHIIVDEQFRQDLWPDDIAHQFMLQNKFNIALTDLMVCHDHALKNNIKLNIDQNFLRNKNSHNRFIEKYGWDWGYRNKFLRTQFEFSKMNQQNTLQKKIFDIRIEDGPKRIEDFE